MRILLALTVAFSLCALACADPLDSADQIGIIRVVEPVPQPTLEEQLNAKAEITLEGSSAYYRGVLNGANVGRFLAATDEHPIQIDTLIINSRGGETSSARRLGEWIFEHGVTVVVEELCFSSCANYVFTSAPRKIIRADALVGWHGSEQQERYLDIQPRDARMAECREEPRENVFLANPRVEQEFLDRTGVRSEALLWGFASPRRCRHYFGAGVDGWTFSINGMALLGIRNVSYEGPGEYPSETARERRPVIVYQVGLRDLH